MGNVREIRERGDTAVLTLDGVGDIAIKNDKSLISKLRGARGQRVGILRTDVPGKEYILRKFTRG
ncbi:MAG: hypothetical protein ACTSQ8_23830 [Candidatus Helarchaeota archaeon]